jgi:hypothetical protein
MMTQRRDADNSISRLSPVRLAPAFQTVQPGTSYPSEIISVAFLEGWPNPPFQDAFSLRKLGTVIGPSPARRDRQLSGGAARDAT